jgi:hypothetical protein
MWLVLAAALHFLNRAYKPVDEVDIELFARIWKAPLTDATRRLYGAYLSRARRYRTTCSVIGWVSAIVLTYALGGTQIGIGFGSHPVYSDLLVMGFGGYLLGALVAELHHLRRRGAGPRVASLSVRSLDTYVARRDQTFLRIAILWQSAAAIAYVAIRALTGSEAPFDAAIVAYGLIVVGVWGLVEHAERAVVTRSRPAMSEDLAAGDDAIRAASINTLVLGGSGLVLLLGGWGSSLVAQSYRNTVGTQSWVLVFSVSAFVSFGTSIVLAFRARRLAWPRNQVRRDKVAA